MGQLYILLDKMGLDEMAINHLIKWRPSQGYSSALLSSLVGVCVLSNNLTLLILLSQPKDRIYCQSTSSLSIYYKFTRFSLALSSLLLQYVSCSATFGIL